MHWFHCTALASFAILCNSVSSKYEFNVFFEHQTEILISVQRKMSLRLWISEASASLIDDVSSSICQFSGQNHENLFKRDDFDNECFFVQKQNVTNNAVFINFAGRNIYRGIEWLSLNWWFKRPFLVAFWIYPKQQA